MNLPKGIEINNLIHSLRTFCWEAADILTYYSRKMRDPSDKKKILKNVNEDDPVTLADLMVNEIIIKRIKESYKDVDWEILSEENVKMSAGNCDFNSDWLWILDPLDGTKDFIQGTKNYAMHLGLNYKKKPLLGLVLIPEKNELWFAYGETVWGEKRDGSKIELNLSKNKNIRDMTLVTSKNHRNQTLNNLIQKINFNEVLLMGSIGCKIASILRGESNIYISLSLPGKSSPKDWDFAAPEAILKGAGGSITNLNNEELIYNQSNFEQQGIIVASSDKNLHKDICMQIKEIIEKDDVLFSSLN